MYAAIYNSCLREGDFPKTWKKAKIIPIVKSGKEGSDEVNKFHPISLLDSGGKLLEKLFINRINQLTYSRGHMNENQFGFRPYILTYTHTYIHTYIHTHTYTYIHT